MGKARERRLCLAQALVAEIKRAAVMCLEDEEANHFSRELLEDVLHCKEVVL